METVSRLDSLSWPAVPSGATVLLPVGSTEQHGPHLPFDTDTRIAVAVTSVVAERMRGAGTTAIVAPALAYGASGEHQSFAGTTSMGHVALRAVLIELVRSLSTWAERIVLVNGHGGNVPTLAAAVPQVRSEGHDVTWLSCSLPPAQPQPLPLTGAGRGAAAFAADAHAGRVETSLLLHIAPATVTLPLPEAGNTRPVTELLPLMTTGGVAAVSPSGILGDPTGATAEEGRALLDLMATNGFRRISADNPDARGMLR